MAGQWNGPTAEVALPQPVVVASLNSSQAAAADGQAPAAATPALVAHLGGVQPGSIVEVHVRSASSGVSGAEAYPGKVPSTTD